MGDNGEKPLLTVCSVCVATYKRAELLDKLLQSLLDQVLPEGVNAEVVVVDNDAEGSAEPIVRRYRDTDRMTFRYFRQPIKNISLTRNMGIREATGTYVLLIDDDEIACPEWIARLLRTLHKYDADGVFGPSIPTYKHAVPEWLRKGERLLIDTIPKTSTGTEAVATWSSNCLMKASIVKGLEGPFDPKYGTTGGEDTELFNRLKHNKARFVYCNEACAYEYWPPERTRVAYLMRRSFKGTNSLTRRTIRTSKRKVITCLLMLIKSMCFGIISLALILFSFPSKVWRTYWQMKLASNAGRFLGAFGYHFQAYK